MSPMSFREVPATDAKVISVEKFTANSKGTRTQNLLYMECPVCGRTAFRGGDKERAAARHNNSLAHRNNVDIWRSEQFIQVEDT